MKRVRFLRNVLKILILRDIKSWKFPPLSVKAKIEHKSQLFVAPSTSRYTPSSVRQQSSQVRRTLRLSLMWYIHIYAYMHTFYFYNPGVVLRNCMEFCDLWTLLEMYFVRHWRPGVLCGTCTERLPTHSWHIPSCQLRVRTCTHTKGI
jgi:hypothetical protein